MLNIFILNLQYKFLTFLLLRFSTIDAVRRAVKIMKSSYQGAWIRWADVPEERKRQWFIGFKVLEILALFSLANMTYAYMVMIAITTRHQLKFLDQI